MLNAPDGETWTGQRESVLFAVMYNTGARVSETIGLRRDDLNSGQARSLRIRGKGGRTRGTPVEADGSRGETMAEATELEPSDPLFPNNRGRPLSRSGVEDRLAVAVAKAAKRARACVTRRYHPTRSVTRRRCTCSDPGWT